MSYKEEFISIAREYIHREDIDEMLINLDKTDFYTAPASTKYHDSEEGGLVKHSIKVFKYLVELSKGMNIDMESIAIVALFHDLCKVGYYTVEYRNTKDENGKWIKVPYYSVKDQTPLGHGSKSAYLVNESIKLTYDELLAITWHMGGFEPKENYGYVSEAYSQCPLAVLLHMADLKATYIK